MPAASLAAPPLLDLLRHWFGLTATATATSTTATPAPPSRGLAASKSATDGTPTPAPPARGYRIAIVHDFLYTYGGAERVLEQMIAVFPEADLFSLFDFLPDEDRHFLQGKTPTTTWVQKIPFARGRHRHLFPLMPLAVEQLDVSAYDVILSSSNLAAKGVITSPDQLHICYCHSPARFAWDLQHQYLEGWGMQRGIKSLIVRALLHYLRGWDQRSANGVDLFLSNSRFIARRIWRAYRRRAMTLYPPVATHKFISQDCDADRSTMPYVTASRLVEYKRVDLIVEAFNRMPHRRLVVIGEGPNRAKLDKLAGPNVELVGFQSDEELVERLCSARAFVFAAEEDFGIVPIEAMACGTPVIAFGKGGATETVIEGRTGLLFDKQEPASLMDAVDRFERQKAWDPATIREHAESFNEGRFRDQLEQIVEDEWALAHDHKHRGASRQDRDGHADAEVVVTPAGRAPSPPRAMGATK